MSKASSVSLRATRTMLSLSGTTDRQGGDMTSGQIFLSRFVGRERADKWPAAATTDFLISEGVTAAGEP